MMQLHEITAVRETEEAGVYVVAADLTDMEGERYVADYASRPDDGFGLAPQIRAGLDLWIAQGRPVAPYVPPTAQELRVAMPELSRRQLRLGLLAAGITSTQVTGEIDAMPEGNAKETARIEWEDATVYQRTHPLIQTIGAALGLSPEQIDDMWMAASAL